MAPTGKRLQTLILTALVPAAILLAPTPGPAQIEIPGLRPGSTVEAWTEGQHVILRTEDGRLFSVPLTTPGIERALEGLSSAATHPADAVTISDIIDMLRAGISEATIQAHLQASGAETVDLRLTKDDLIELKQAGASEAFLQYLIRLGQGTPKTTLIRWGRPAWPPRPVADTGPDHPPAETVSFQEGIPVYPYVFPGYGVSYPQSGGYWGFRYLPQYDSHSPYTGRKNLRPYGASLVKAPEDRPHYRSPTGYPKPEPYRQGGNGGLMIRWNGPRQGGGGKAGIGNTPTSSASSHGRMIAPTGSSSFRKGISSPGAPRTTGRSGRAGRSATGRSGFLGSRSLVRKH